VRTLIVLLSAAALLAAGCGGGDGGSETTTAAGPPLTKAAYQAKLKQIATDISTRIGKTSTSNKIPKEDVDTLVDAFHTFADRLADVNPPAAVSQLHARLIKTMDDLGDEFPDIADELNSSGKDPSAAIKALFGAQAIQELVKIGQDFKKQGYDLDLNP
jgi:hypothetical protein